MDKTVLPQVALYLKDSPGKGRGVFAGEHIKASTLIAICPVLLFPDGATTTVGVNGPISSEREVLNSYTYTWNSNTQALSLGLGSMFNHTKKCNVVFTIDKDNMLIRYHTLVDVPPDMELCINYGPKLWFDDGDESGSDSNSSDDEGQGFLGRIDL
jgi:SET domain-containing protein